MDEKDEFRRYTSRYKTEKILPIRKLKDFKKSGYIQFLLSLMRSSVCAMIQLIMHKSRNLSEKKRRDQFNMLINELCSMVTSSNRKMDKSSVLRSTISFLKNHSELSVQSQSVKVQENWKPSFLSNEEFTHLMLEALDGFIIVFSCNGQILYTSESTASLLGYLPSRIYSSVFDIIHEMDKSSLYKLISSPPSSSNNSISKDSFVSLTLHMKRGPIHSQGSSSYELVQLLGTFYHWPSSYEGSNSAAFDCDSNSCSSICSMPSAGGELRSCFVAVGRLQTPHLLRGVNLSDDTKNEFTSRHSLEWKFLFLDHRAPPIIGYLPFEVLGTSGYDYYHVDDLDNIAASHELLMTTGEGTSCFYRFLTKGQQWIWLQTRYYISYHQWNSKPEFIVCTHTVVSTEKVLKSIQEMPKRFLKKTSSNHNSSPTQSACLSPSPSISSLGSLSSDPLEQASAKSAGSSNVRVNTVLYPREKLMPSPISRAPPPPLADSFAEPHPHLTSLHQVSQGVNSDMNAISSTGPGIISPQSSHISPDHSTPLPPPPLMSPDVSVVPQFQGEQSPSAVNQVQMHEYLRRRHQILQQQIMAQQEELRRVSEQLMLVQFANPNAVPSAHVPDIQYQQVNDMNPDMGNYVNASYQTSRPTTQQMKAPTSAENIGMKSMDNYSRTTHNTVTSRSYLNLEADMCGVGTSNRMPLLSSEQTSEAIAQGYSTTHSMQSNT